MTRRSADFAAAAGGSDHRMISRRDLLKGAATGICAVPFVADALQAEPYRIGFLHPSSPSAVVDATYAGVFERALEASAPELSRWPNARFATRTSARRLI